MLMAATSGEELLDRFEKHQSPQLTKWLRRDES